MFPFPAIPFANVVFAFTESNLAGQVIVVVLVVGSVFVWSVMVTKIWEIYKATRVTRRFLAAYRKEGNPLGLFLKRHRFDDSPAFQTYASTCEGIAAMAGESVGEVSGDLFRSGADDDKLSLTRLQVESLENIEERTMAELAVGIEHNMGFLAIATNAAPFLGLLGTVWGVMEAFEGMVMKGSAMLAQVAPGISGALLTTVVGLLVALPSSIGYNIITGMIRKLSVVMENFARELSNDLQRRYLTDAGKGL